jgi:nitroreductase
MLARRSASKVTEEAPSPAQVRQFVEAAGQLADHSGLAPWRVIEIRGDARDRVGAALAEAEGVRGSHSEKYRAKARRAPLILAVVASHRPNGKVPRWEQDAVAAGVAHALSLVLDDEGWGVMWRTGLQIRSEPVRAAHQLEHGEQLLGWLYVGGVPRGARRERPRGRIRVSEHLSTL